MIFSWSVHCSKTELHGNFTTISVPGTWGVNVRNCQPASHLRVPHGCPVSLWPRASSSILKSPIFVWRLSAFCPPREGVHLVPQLCRRLPVAWLVFQRLLLGRPFLHAVSSFLLETAGNMLATLTFGIHPSVYPCNFPLKECLILSLNNTKKNHCIAKVVSETESYLDAQI